MDKEIQDMGIVFDSAYTIYDVKKVNGHRLLKLRNPPGDHDEWKGDWSDKSPLWTKKLKKKLGNNFLEYEGPLHFAAKKELIKKKKILSAGIYMAAKEDMKLYKPRDKSRDN